MKLKEALKTVVSKTYVVTNFCPKNCEELCSAIVSNIFSGKNRTTVDFMHIIRLKELLTNNVTLLHSEGQNSMEVWLF